MFTFVKRSHFDICRIMSYRKRTTNIDKILNNKYFALLIFICARYFAIVLDNLPSALYNVFKKKNLF